MNQLPEEKIDQIGQDARAHVRATFTDYGGRDLCGSCYKGFVAGATAEAERSLILLEALKTLRSGLFEDAEAVNSFIDEALIKYNEHLC